MKHVNAYVYYVLGEYVHDLMVIDEDIKVTPEVLTVLTQGMGALLEFKGHEDHERFLSSVEAADRLIVIISNLLKLIAQHAQGSGGGPVRFTKDIATDAKQAIHHFESMLAKELEDLPLFSVEEKGSYSLQYLIRGASHGYPSSTKPKLSDAIMSEIDESGRCLAFSRPTASGFHILRSLELLIKEYVSKTNLQLPPPNRCNWGEYIQILRSGKAPKQITDLLQIIKDNYRNPVMHPEDTLTLDEAISLFGICQSATEIICRHIP